MLHNASTGDFRPLANLNRLGVLVCPYASSLGLAARQITPTFDAAIYRPYSTSYTLQPSFHTSSTEPEPTARARRTGKEFY